MNIDISKKKKTKKLIKLHVIVNISKDDQTKNDLMHTMYIIEFENKKILLLTINSVCEDKENFGSEILLMSELLRQGRKMFFYVFIQKILLQEILILFVCR